MKKNSIYIVTLILFAIAVVSVFFKYKNEEREKEATVYTLQPRRGASATSPEWAVIKNNAAALSEALRRNPNDTKSSLAMAALFIQEGRVTGNHMYYDVAAMRYISDVLKKDSANFNALIFKSLLYLSQHHFAEGLATAQKAQSINPYNAFVYGILVDGNVEMGNYTTAVENSDKMVSIRPDLRSYSRISYLREIFGDLPGAIDAMKMAVEAGAPGDEASEWARVQLGRLYEVTGQPKYAEMHYTIALDERPGYAYALAGLARLATATKDYPKAIALYEKADSAVNDYAFKEDLVEVYTLAGMNAKADAASKAVVSGLSENAKKGQTDEGIGHYADRELAYAYLKTNDYGKALEHAMLEYNRRPENIDVNETVAWVYNRKGDYAQALPYIKAALKTNCKSPVLLCHAGLVYFKAGDRNTAKPLLQEGLKNNPVITPSLKSESMAALQTL